MVAKQVIIGLAPGSIIAAIIADHITNTRTTLSGVHEGSMLFMDMLMSRHMAASISSIMHCLMNGEAPGQGGD